MGSIFSSDKQPCNHCALVSEFTDEFFQCKRCGAINFQKKESDSNGVSSKKSLEDKNSKKSGSLPTDSSKLKYVILTPFRETIPDNELREDKDKNEMFFVQNYLKPYFEDKNLRICSGDRFEINYVTFKVMHCFPSNAMISSSTQILCTLPSLSALKILRRLHVIPTQTTLENCKSSDWYNECLKPFLHEPRNLIEGETFICSDIQFRVMSCEPNSGVTDASTEIYIDGDPLVDLKSAHMLPIYHTLPNRDKNLSEIELIERYIKPFTEGFVRFIRVGEILCIDGVEFKVISASPNEGIITLSTQVSAAGSALLADDLRRKQEEEDEAMARRMQFEDAAEPIRFSFPIPSSIRPGSEENDLLRIHNRMNSLLQVMGRDPRMAHLPAAFENILQRAASSSGRLSASEASSASSSDIDALPTHKFKLSVSTPVKNPELQKCLICLTEYEENDELRTLPCFHNFHRECVDEWLKRNKKCPTCRHEIC